MLLCATEREVHKERDYLEMLNRNMVDGIISGSHRLEAYLQERGIHVQTNAFDWSRFDFGYYLEYASKCLNEMPDLDGVFAADILAAAFVFVGRMKGKQIPQKLKVIAYDGSIRHLTLTLFSTKIEPS